MNWDIIIVAAIAAVPGLVAAWQSKRNGSNLTAVKTSLNSALDRLIALTEAVSFAKGAAEGAAVEARRAADARLVLEALRAGDATRAADATAAEAGRTATALRDAETLRIAQVPPVVAPEAPHVEPRRTLSVEEVERQVAQFRAELECREPHV